MIIKNKTKTEPIALRIELNGKDAKKFDELQQQLGIYNKSEVIRFCLSFTYKNYPKKI